VNNAGWNMQRWLRRLIGLALVGLLGFYPLLAPPAHRIDQHHFELTGSGVHDVILDLGNQYLLYHGAAGQLHLSCGIVAFFLAEPARR
jgi:hypothetical protein